jgi:hypothetical protein
MAKLNPAQNPFKDEENVVFALNFLNSTQLSRCLFWKTMTLSSLCNFLFLIIFSEQKMKIVKSMTMRGDSDPLSLSLPRLF